MAIGDLVIDAYGISWTLDVSSTEPILYYNHPSFGMLMYQYVSAGGRPWQCNNVNTMTLVSHGSLPEGVLKQHICVKPRYDYSDSIADCGFTSADDRCNCADPCCPCIEGTIVLECGTLQKFYGRWCTGGRIGIADPAGPSREWCLTFYDFESTAHLLCTVIYCDGTSWLMDIYCDGDFVSTQTMSLASKCPLRFTFSIPSLNCAVCSGIAVSCSAETVPNTIHAEITSATLGTVDVTMTHNSGNTWSGEITLDCGSILRGNINFCYGDSPTSAASGWQIVPASGLGLCWSFGSATNGYTVNGTLSPLLFSASSGVWTSEATASCDCGSLDGESVTETYTV